LVTATNNKSKPVTRPVNYTKNRNEKPRENSETTRKANTNAASWLMTCTTNFPHPLPQSPWKQARLSAIWGFTVIQCGSNQKAKCVGHHNSPPTNPRRNLSQIVGCTCNIRWIYRGEWGSQRCFTGHRMDFWLCGRNGMSLDRFGFGISRRRVQEPKSLADIDNNPATQWFHKREMKRRRWFGGRVAGRKPESSHVGVH